MMLTPRTMGGMITPILVRPSGVNAKQRQGGNGSRHQDNHGNRDQSRQQPKDKRRNETASRNSHQCPGCGKVHRLDACYSQNHPDVNKNLSIPFLESFKGKNYKSVGFNHLRKDKRLSKDRKSLESYTSDAEDTSDVG